MLDGLEIEPLVNDKYISEPINVGFSAHDLNNDGSVSPAEYSSSPTLPSCYTHDDGIPTRTKEWQAIVY